MSQITLSKRITENSDGTYRLQVWVSETTDNIPSEIFLQRTVPTVDDWEGPSAAYYGICNYADLVNYAVDTSDGASNFYRIRGVDLDYKSVYLLNATWNQMETDAQSLVDDIVRTHAATGSDVSYTGTNFDVVATLKHYDSDGYSYKLDMTATESIFVLEKQTDSEPELVSVASLADMGRYGSVEISVGYYRSTTVTLFFGDEDTYLSTKVALNTDFADLDSELTDPGISFTGSGSAVMTNSEAAGPFYFGE